MYYNTTSEAGDTLKYSQVKAETQTEKVLAFFFKYREDMFTPSSVHGYIGGNSPLTSTRRAISDLTKDNKLEKTIYKGSGSYGKPEYCWRLKKQEGQTSLFD